MREDYERDFSRKASDEPASFAYDDAFKTMYIECDDLLLPLVNEMFDEQYDSTASIIRRGNEHFMGQDERDNQEKRITDSLFDIRFNDIVKRYHIECESSKYDGSILIRLFEYDAQIALDEGYHDNDIIEVTFPHTGLLVLRNARRRPDKLTVRMNTPGGSMEYQVRVLYVTDYDIDLIFEKHLYFLIPFYIFRFERRLKKIDGDNDEMRDLANRYARIMERLSQATDKDLLSAYSKNVIMKASRSVMTKLANRQKNVTERLGDVMGGGKVMDLDIIRIKHAAEDKGWYKGLSEGRSEGEIKVLTSQVCRKIRKNKSAEQIAEDLDEEIGRIKEIYAIAMRFKPNYDEDEITKVILEESKKDKKVGV